MPDNTPTPDSVTHLFFKNVPPIAGDETINLLPSLLHDFSSMSMEAVYILDFLKQGFYFVADRDFFLCGHSVEEAFSLGYDFFPKVILNKDITLLQVMHSAILQHLLIMDRPTEIN